MATNGLSTKDVKLLTLRSRQLEAILARSKAILGGNEALELEKLHRRISTRLNPDEPEALDAEAESLIEPLRGLHIPNGDSSEEGAVVFPVEEALAVA
jgi:hypothetical protein